MSTPKLSIITPTCGRRTLYRILIQTARQMHDDDEHIVVADGELPHVDALMEEVTQNDRRFVYLPSPRANRMGNPQRDLAIQHAKGDWIVFLDDDDVFTPNGLGIIRSAVRNSERVPHLFLVNCLRQGQAGIVGTSHKLGAHADLRGSMIVPPNDKERLAHWDDPTCDTMGTASQREFAFLNETIAAFGGRCVWVDMITHVVPKAGEGKLDA